MADGDLRLINHLQEDSIGKTNLDIIDIESKHDSNKIYILDRNHGIFRLH